MSRWTELRERWAGRRALFAELDASVNGAKLIDELLADLDTVLTTHEDEVLRVPDAAKESGYSEEHLRRLIRTGKVANAGRAGAPAIRRADLPAKRSLPEFPTTAILRSKVQIARTVTLTRGDQ